MKILQIRAILSPNAGGGIHYNYPAEYDAEKISVLCYEHVGDSAAVRDRNMAYEYLIGLVSDEDAPGFLKSNLITELTQEAAIVKGRKWRPQVEKIDNPGIVLSILAKSVRGENLTQEDMDAIDPESIARGITKSKLFDDLLNEQL